jgi:hypothetical protein
MPSPFFPRDDRTLNGHSNCAGKNGLYSSIIHSLPLPDLPGWLS